MNIELDPKRIARVKKLKFKSGSHDQTKGKRPAKRKAKRRG
jgi:hypothetical protein